MQAIGMHRLSTTRSYLVFGRFSPDVAYDAAVLGELRVAEIAAGLRTIRDDPVKVL